MNKIEAWIKRMYDLWDTPYVFGGKDVGRDGGLDCSGLITSTAPKHCLGKPALTNAEALKGVGPQVPKTGAQRGDIVLFSRTYGNYAADYATHVGVWVRPGYMIDTHDGVHETYFDGSYWGAKFLGIWRPTAMQEVEDPAVIAELQQQVASLKAELANEKSWGSAILANVIVPATNQLDTVLAAPNLDPAAVAAVRQLLADNGGRGQ